MLQQLSLQALGSKKVTSKIIISIRNFESIPLFCAAYSLTPTYITNPSVLLTLLLKVNLLYF